MSATILIMAKAPRPGVVKTRLQPMLGPRGCAALQAALLGRVAAMAGRVTDRVVVAFDPPDARAEMIRLLPGSVGLLPQRGTHLGVRMAAAVADVAAACGGPVVVVGTDVPALTEVLLRAALDALTGSAEVVLGPACDGGYYLLGLRRPVSGVFDIDPVLWGGPGVLAATLARLHADRRRVELLPTLRDLDTQDDAAALLEDPLLPADIAGALRRAGAS
jgi:rSAM/selenodomain-associated transferase 1